MVFAKTAAFTRIQSAAADKADAKPALHATRAHCTPRLRRSIEGSAPQSMASTRCLAVIFAALEQEIICPAQSGS
jgi:hypothetical protein